MRIAFLGLRHGHAVGMYAIARREAGVTVVGAAEEDAATAARVREQNKVEVTHDSYERLLKEVACDAVVVGDYYGRRGDVILRALEAGKHVLADKPICTRLSELEAIEKLARAKKRVVGCMLDARTLGVMKGLRGLIAEGRIGEVQTVNFTAQHPLLPETRPRWYFEEGKHGGIINDIAVHAMDLIEWLSGRQLSRVTAARAWNLGRTPAYFQEAGQVMLELDNGGGVLGDVSYLAPNGCGYRVPQYWRVIVHGKEGVAEAQGTSLAVATHTSAGMEAVAAPADEPAGILTSFVSEVEGRGATGGPTSAEVLRAARLALLVQQAADENRRDVELPR